MNSVERVKELCKEKNIPISKLEKDLGYANGYVGQLKKGSFPDDRLKKISEYLEVSIDYLLGDSKQYFTNCETARIAQEILDNKELRILFDASRDATPEDLLFAAEMIRKIKTNKNF